MGTGACSGQAYTEYVVILVVLGLAMGAGIAGYDTMIGFYDDLRDYYASLANYLNLPFL